MHVRSEPPRSASHPTAARRPRALFLRLALGAALVLTAHVPWRALAQTDDFDDGNDAGWTRYSPLTPFGAGAKYTFPSGGYRVQAPASPDAASLGPARAGSLRPVVYDRFSAAVDLVGWDTNLNEAIGVIARVTNLGLGTTDGYTFNYNTRSGYLQINLAVDEAAARALAEEHFPLDPTNRYRLVFTGTGSDLVGQVFNTSDLQTPLHSLFATDDSYPAGTAGVFGFDLSNTGAVDVVFDNYEAKAPAPLRATVLNLRPWPGQLLTDPVDTVVVELLNRETAADLQSLRLWVDGLAADITVAADFMPITVSYYPVVPLAPDQAHHGKLVFNDALGAQTTEWDFGPPKAVAVTQLLGAPSLAGPFAAETSAVLDPAAKSFTLARPGGTRFYRLRSDLERRITSVRVLGTTLTITYQ